MYNDENISLDQNFETCEVPKLLSQIATVDEELGVNEVDDCVNYGTECLHHVSESTTFAIKVNDTTTYKFYVIEDNGDEVTLIMSKNLTEVVKWIDQSYYESNGGANWGDNVDRTSTGPLAALNSLMSSTNDSWTNISKIKYTIRDDIVANKYEPITLNSRVRMLTKTEVNLLILKNNNTVPNYLYDSSLGVHFWLSTADATNNACSLTVS